MNYFKYPLIMLALIGIAVLAHRLGASDPTMIAIGLIVFFGSGWCLFMVLVGLSNSSEGKPK